MINRQAKQIADLPGIVSQNETNQNAIRYSDKENAREESDKATSQAILSTMSSGIELYNQIQANESLRKWVYNMVFNETYAPNIGGSQRQ